MVEELDSALALIRTAPVLVGAVTCIWRMYRKIRGDRPQVVPLSMRARAGRRRDAPDGVADLSVLRQLKAIGGIRERRGRRLMDPQHELVAARPGLRRHLPGQDAGG